MTTCASSSHFNSIANVNPTTDGLRGFDYDEANRHALTAVTHLGEASKIT